MSSKSYTISVTVESSSKTPCTVGLGSSPHPDDKRMNDIKQQKYMYGKNFTIEKI